MSRKDEHQLMSEALAGILEKTTLSLNSIVKKIKSVSDDMNLHVDQIRELEIYVQKSKRYLDTLIDERNQCEEQIEQIKIMRQRRILDSQTCRDAIERYCRAELYRLIKRAKEIKRLYKEEDEFPLLRSKYQRDMYYHKIVIRVLFLCLAYARKRQYSSVEKKIYIQYDSQRHFMMKRLRNDMVDVIHRALSTVVLEDGEVTKIGGYVKNWLGEKYE